MPADPDARQRARDYLRRALTIETRPIQIAVTDARVDAYGIAAHVIGSAPTMTVPADVVSAGVDWGSWEPGDAAAAGLLRDGGLARLLAASDVEIRSIADSMVDQLGTRLADGVEAGDSVDSITSDLAGMIDDPDRAFMIADTEVARGMQAGSNAAYQASGVELFDWIASPGACPECEDMSQGGPYQVGSDETPPLHPYCRCATAASTDGTNDSGDDDTTDEGEGNDGG